LVRFIIAGANFFLFSPRLCVQSRLGKWAAAIALNLRLELWIQFTPASFAFEQLMEAWQGCLASKQMLRRGLFRHAGASEWLK
jgi:hypothetical protein